MKKEVKKEVIVKEDLKVIEVLRDIKNHLEDIEEEVEEELIHLIDQGENPKNILQYLQEAIKLTKKEVQKQKKIIKNHKQEIQFLKINIKIKNQIQ